ncbi:hypothetical protein JKF63_07589 [Porcisia hertigi]|uniref:Uncharacterized protein n=1 Tax=Porcisia hertigi TaxID=2761500 RepID=A0A836LM29_9TRYP|nr:hypothetical protein JKF63_07589 [Porcisia hertigi]
MSNGFLPSVQAGSTAALSPAPTTSTSSGATSTFVKVYCGDDECVPLSKQCTGGVFQGILADLANRVSKRNLRVQRGESVRRATAASAAAADAAVHLAPAVPCNSGGEYSGRATPPATENQAVTAGICDEAAVRGGVMDPKKRQLAPSMSKPSSPVPTSKGVASDGGSTVSSYSTAMSLTAAAAVTSASDPVAGVDDVRMARSVEYRRAELLPLSFVRDITSNSKVIALYKQHLQLQEQVRRYQLEQEQLQKQADEDEASAAVTAPKKEGAAADAAHNQSTANRADVESRKAQTTKASPRRRGMAGGGGGRGASNASGNRGAPSGNAATISPVAAAALSSQARALLWTTLRNTIPFLGVLTMPAHTTMEPLVSLSTFTPANGTSAAAAAAAAAASRPAPSATPTPSATGLVSAATAVCSGSYVLLGCRERPREAAPAADRSSVLPALVSPSALIAPPVIGGAAAHASMLAVEQLVEQAREASVARLPLLSAEVASLNNNFIPVTPVSTGEATKRSPRKPRGHAKDTSLQQMPHPSLPMRCTLQPGTNRVVSMAPPLPEDIAAGYGAARLVTKSLTKPPAEESEAGDNSRAHAGARARNGAAKGSIHVPSSRARSRLLELTAQRSAAAAGASAAGSPEGAGYSSSKVASLAGSSRSGRCISSASPSSNKDGVNGSEVEAPTGAQPPSAPASNGSSPPPGSSSANSGVGSSGHSPAEAVQPPSEADPSIPLSAAVVARLMPSTRFTVQLSTCSVALNAPPRQAAGSNGADATFVNPAGAGDTSPDELGLTFDGLDVLWHGPNGEEALLQWVLDEYSILLKQRIAVAMVQWTSMARAGDSSAGAVGGSSSKAGKTRGRVSPERQLA